MGTSDGRLCLVTGATGYVGGRLVPELLAAGHRVRVVELALSRIQDIQVATRWSSPSTPGVRTPRFDPRHPVGN
jgi:nucleoside-diphosphate-sugar epimerase